ncbi:Metallo-dependent phosphatase-like protein [Catenaria anguillulae PL171]|uniref:Metallo-dependent phosphatase-like protein n=1 Tax=Catenaria anguillulae PL171 TaxID=765915 RepID=A0A1Y2HMG0_9FUNG|nr:Metallo-dependent phosphatase-like protein [Catenaria anguillulae PL171]
MTLIHTNDLHGHYDEFAPSGIDCTDKNRAEKKCYGGIARIKTIVDQIRATEPNTYMVDAGDEFQGTLFYSYYRGNITAEYMNAIGLDAFTIGNHEFDDGIPLLSKFLGLLRVPVISSNMDVANEPLLKDRIAPYVVLTKYGARIGMIGFITKTAPDIIANPSKNVKFSDPAGESGPVQRAVNELQAMGIKRIIAVSHNGLDDDKIVAESTKGINLIVGGHSHSLMSKNSSLPDVKGTYPLPVTNKEGKKTYIVQAKAWGEYIGKLSIAWDAESNIVSLDGDPIHLTMDIAQHNATQEVVKKWRAPFDAAAKEVVGNSKTAMKRGDCNDKACPLGWFIAETLRKSYSGSLPNFGMINAGGIRADLGAGDIRVGDIMGILPFPNSQVVIEMPGDRVLTMLEHLALTADGPDAKRKDGKTVSSFAQFSGLRARLDKSKPKYERVYGAEVEVAPGKWEPVEKSKKYAVVTLDFMANGGDAIVPLESKAKTVDVPESVYAPGVRFAEAGADAKGAQSKPSSAEPGRASMVYLAVSVVHACFVLFLL